MFIIPVVAYSFIIISILYISWGCQYLDYVLLNGRMIREQWLGREGRTQLPEKTKENHKKWRRGSVSSETNHALLKVQVKSLKSGKIYGELCSLLWNYPSSSTGMKLQTWRKFSCLISYTGLFHVFVSMYQVVIL
jgi:hypothetical protein